MHLEPCPECGDASDDRSPLWAPGDDEYGMDTNEIAGWICWVCEHTWDLAVPMRRNSSGGWTAHIIYGDPSARTASSNRTFFIRVDS